MRQQGVVLNQRVFSEVDLIWLHEVAAKFGEPGEAEFRNDDGLIASEGITAVECREREGGVIACGVLDGAAVESERGSGLVIEIGRGIAVLDGVCKGESAGAGSRGVVEDLIGGSGFKGELRGAARGVDGDGF